MRDETILILRFRGAEYGWTEEVWGSTISV